MIKVLRYSSVWCERYDDLVDRSPQGTFLLKRGYLEYHSHRFCDMTLLALDHKGRLVAVLPASIDGETVTSHGGLTYGGWITDSKLVDCNVMLDIFQDSLRYLRSLGVANLIYKPVPTIYHKYPAQDDIYALFRVGATPAVINISTAIDVANPIAFDSNAKRAVKYAAEQGVTLRDDVRLSEFWPLLTQLLRSKYNTEPVHTLAEIEMLAARFPDNIHLHCAVAPDGEVVAGVLIYLTHTVAHCQYIASSDNGKQLKALPLLFKHLIQLYTPMVRYFDFGTSNEDGGRYLSAGLIRQKAGMGGRGVAYTCWNISL